MMSDEGKLLKNVLLNSLGHQLDRLNEINREIEKMKGGMKKNEN
ncbi:MAG: hypothetical protein OEL89_01260 [Candidatus Peregrinibacteria bacterium]|nr:hypothetical protein [Candidatus Peregrinibacteria bacterium]